VSTIPSTLEIAAKAKPHQIFEIAAKCGLRADEIDAYGNFKAKVALRVLDRFADRPNGKLICVSGMTPTREGDGKTCTSVGLTQALGKLKKKVILCLREPSLAPLFGFKGGATGVGYSQVLPMEDINLHFTGDIHAIERGACRRADKPRSRVQTKRRKNLAPAQFLKPDNRRNGQRSEIIGFLPR